MDQMNNKWVVFYKGEHYINIIRSDTSSSTENEYNVTLLIEPVQNTSIVSTVNKIQFSYIKCVQHFRGLLSVIWKMM